MDDLDRKIEDALNEEDRTLLAEYGELDLFGQLGSLFTGKLAWYSVVTFAIGTIAVAIGLWAAWNFIQAEEPATMLRWAALAWAAFMTQITLKIMSWLRMETNRTLREVKRLELQIARAFGESAAR